jgi:hypothetical protein
VATARTTHELQLQTVSGFEMIVSIRESCEDFGIQEILFNGPSLLIGMEDSGNPPAEDGMGGGEREREVGQRT